MKKTNTLFLIAAIVLVVAVLVTGFILLGSPSKQRSIALDARRVQDLQTLANQINEYSRQHALELRASSTSSTSPASLQDIVSYTTKYGSKLVMSDPISNIPYEYRKTGERDYELCAEFATDSKDSNTRNNYYPSPYGGTLWEHPAGRHCFTFAINKSPYDGSLYPEVPNYPYPVQVD